MATIKARTQRDGSVRYTAVIRIRQGAAIVHQEAKTFSHRSAAQLWAKHREVALNDPKELSRASHPPVTLASLIHWYIETFEEVSKWQRSKQAHLRFLENHTIGQANVIELTTADLLEHVQARRDEGAGPATVANDLVWVGVVLRAAKSFKKLPIDPNIVVEARGASRELRLVSKATRRTRRPTPDELKRLEEFFQHRDRRSDMPMADIMNFAIYSARRQAEICRIKWSDNDARSRSGLVRDAKHPKLKDGNHRRFKYTKEAWEIVQRQPKGSEFIFPFSERTVGAAFTRACRVLGIPDLHFHDLRHEATSRLFERGYHIHEVAQFTLHDSWAELKRYANVRPETLRELEAPTTTPPEPASAAPTASRARTARRRRHPPTDQPAHDVRRSAEQGERQ